MNQPPSKKLKFLGSSLDDIRAFPDESRQAAGHQLSRVEQGEEPNDWKPMPSVGAGVREIRIKDDNGAFRVFYVANKPEGIYVLHAFQKQNNTTPKKEIELGKRRYKEIP